MNAAGDRVYDLIHKQWKTRASFVPTSPSESWSFRGFQGAYNISVLYQGLVEKTELFYIDFGQQEIDINIELP